MSIDINDYIEGALEAVKEQIGEAQSLTNKIWEAGPGYLQDDMDNLEKLLQTASDSVEILQNYNGQYDRIVRQCFGGHPWRYEVQCRLCEVQRLCCEETHRLNAKPDPKQCVEEDPECHGAYPGGTQIRCLICPVKEACAKKRIEFDARNSKKDELKGD